MLGGDASAELTPPLLHPASLEMMCTPQLIDDNTGFGLGFYRRTSIRGRKTVQHSGAVYGFTTLLIAMPDERIAVLVLSNADIAMAPVRRLADLSLEPAAGEAPRRGVARAAEVRRSRQRRSSPSWPASTSRPATGHTSRSTATSSSARFPVSRCNLQATAPLKFLADGRIMDDSPFEFEAGRKTARSTASPPPASEFTPRRPRRRRSSCRLAGLRRQLTGPSSFRWWFPFATAILYATVENEYDYRLTPLNRVTFKPAAGHVLRRAGRVPDRCRRPGDRRDHGQPVSAAPRRVIRPHRSRAFRMQTLIQPDDTWLLWAVILGGVALSIWLEQTYAWAAKLSGPVLALCIAMLLANLRLMPPAAPVYDIITRRSGAAGACRCCCFGPTCFTSPAPPAGCSWRFTWPRSGTVVGAIAAAAVAASIGARHAAGGRHHDRQLHRRQRQFLRRRQLLSTSAATSPARCWWPTTSSWPACS